MTEFMAGGRRRIDRVLDPDFLDGLRDLQIDELRLRRAEADQEAVDLSYARRLLQGRIDIMKAEEERRRGVGPLAGEPRSDQAIVRALAKILADAPQPDPGPAARRHLGTTPSRVGEHRREAERAVADLGGSDLGALSDVELRHALESMTDIEARVSRSRRSVHAVVDTLTDEVARRYQQSDPLELAESR